MQKSQLLRCKKNVKFVLKYSITYYVDPNFKLNLATSDDVKELTNSIFAIPISLQPDVVDL